MCVRYMWYYESADMVTGFDSMSEKVIRWTTDILPIFCFVQSG